MKEFFIVANSFAAPFVSEQSTHYAEGNTPEAALESFAAGKNADRWLYAAIIFDNADAYHKHAAPLARWVCNKQQAIERETAGMGAYSALSKNDSTVEINDKIITIENPREGCVVPFFAKTLAVGTGEKETPF